MTIFLSFFITYVALFGRFQIILSQSINSSDYAAHDLEKILSQQIDQHFYKFDDQYSYVSFVSSHYAPEHFDRMDLSKIISIRDTLKNM